jgi:hypothetical protein
MASAISFLDRVSEFNAKEEVHRYVLISPSSSHTTTATSTTNTTTSSTSSSSSARHSSSVSAPPPPSYDQLAAAIAAFRRNPQDLAASKALDSTIFDIEKAYHVTSITLSTAPIPEDDFEYIVLEEIIHKLLFAEFLSRNKYGPRSFDSFRSLVNTMVPNVSVSVLIGIARQLLEAKKRAGLVVFITNIDAFEGLMQDSDVWMHCKAGFTRSKRLLRWLCRISDLAGPDVKFAIQPRNWDLAHSLM